MNTFAWQGFIRWRITVYLKKYAHGFCFAVLCCGYTLTDFPISIRLTSLALWQSNDCPSASKATLMNMDKYFIWIHYERLHNHNKAKHNKTVCIFLGMYCKPESLLDEPLQRVVRLQRSIIYRWVLMMAVKNIQYHAETSITERAKNESSIFFISGLLAIWFRHNLNKKITHNTREIIVLTALHCKFVWMLKPNRTPR